MEKTKGNPFSVVDNMLHKTVAGVKIPVANFHLAIEKQIIIEDEGEMKERHLQILLKMGDKREIPFTISSNEFLTHKLEQKIFETAGSSAIIYRSIRDLQVGTQELSGKVLEEVTRSHGLTHDGNYLSNGFIITPTGIRKADLRVDLSGGDFSKQLSFLYPDDPKQVQVIGKHLLNDFLELKTHDVTFPLIAHISLAPFTSEIHRLFKKEKVALHLQGPSGGGKTFLGILGMMLFGDFQERIPSWGSTPNSLEVEGHYFRDALFLIDDYKAGLVPSHTVVRIFQNYSGSHGRSRLNPNSTAQKAPFIRGLLLSTGEDFVTGVESVTGRTIRIKVEPEKNIKAGDRCKKYSGLYRMFTPGLIHSVISEADWKGRAKALVDEKTESIHKETQDLSNGLRIASNWSLNALGLEFFTEYLVQLGVIDKERKKKMAGEYMEIVHKHLTDQRATLLGESPVEVFFQVIGQKIEAGNIFIRGLNPKQTKGRVIGEVKDQSVLVFPDIALELLSGHFRAVDQRLPFGRNSLRDALVQEGLIRGPKAGRWSKQFRGEDRERHNGWDFEREAFKKRIAI
jgi:hypothetical protein